MRKIVTITHFVNLHARWQNRLPYIWVSRPFWACVSDVIQNLQFFWVLHFKPWDSIGQVKEFALSAPERLSCFAPFIYSLWSIFCSVYFFAGMFLCGWSGSPSHAAAVTCMQKLAVGVIFCLQGRKIGRTVCYFSSVLTENNMHTYNFLE